MRVQFRSDEIPVQHRLDAWEAMLHDTLGMQAGTLPAAAGFRVNATARASGPLFNLSVTADSHQVMRLSADIARRQWDCYWLYRDASAGVWFNVGGHEFTTRRGDLVLGDADVPFITRAFQNYRHEAIVIPKALLAPFLPRQGTPLLTRLSGRGGVNALAGSFVETLARNWDAIADPAMHAAADTLVRLIGIACGNAAGEHPDAVRNGRLAAAKQYIAHHLDDPDLSPASTARSLGISVRGLHLVFEPTGTTFARYVLRQRLEACRAALLSDRQRDVTDIAFAWGFGTLSGFYRAFHAAFGISPGDMRARGWAPPPGCAELQTNLRGNGSRGHGLYP